jgi:hypothetical protein
MSKIIFIISLVASFNIFAEANQVSASKPMLKLLDGNNESVNVCENVCNAKKYPKKVQDSCFEICKNSLVAFEESKLKDLKKELKECQSMQTALSVTDRGTYNRLMRDYKDINDQYDKCSGGLAEMPECERFEKSSGH